ncbi:MAG: hypothetical protein AABY22_17225 [Nanoarchaeota archaeon]
MKLHEFYSKYANVPLGGRTVSQDLMPKYTMAIESGQMEDIKLLPGAEEG